MSLVVLEGSDLFCEMKGVFPQGADVVEDGGEQFAFGLENVQIRGDAVTVNSDPMFPGGGTRRGGPGAGEDAAVLLKM